MREPHDKAILMHMLEDIQDILQFTDGLDIVAFKNRTAHGYHSLDDSVVWEISIKDIPSLSAAVEDALAKL